MKPFTMAILAMVIAAPCYAGDRAKNATTDCLEILGATPCGAPTLPLPAAGHAAVDQRSPAAGHAGDQAKSAADEATTNYYKRIFNGEAQKDRDAWLKARVCTDQSWGGQLCGNPGERLYTFYPRGPLGTSSNMVTMAQIERVKTRCDYEAKTFFVDDALRTRKEIFDECMNYELVTAGN